MSSETTHKQIRISLSRKVLDTLERESRKSGYSLSSTINHLLSKAVTNHDNNNNNG